MNLEERYDLIKKLRFHGAQTETFLSLLKGKYEKVLDVGCGRGYWSYVGARRGKFKSCYGVDVFDNYRKDQVGKWVKKVGYGRIEKDGDFPYPGEHFDLVFSIDVIEHVEDDLGFLKEKLRVCKKGGEIITGTPNYWRPANIFLMLMGRLKFPRGERKTDYGRCVHLREYKVGDLMDKLILASKGRLKKEDLKVYYCWFGILPLNVGFRKPPFF